MLPWIAKSLLPCWPADRTRRTRMTETSAARSIQTVYISIQMCLFSSMFNFRLKITAVQYCSCLLFCSLSRPANALFNFASFVSNRPPSNI